MTDVNTNEFWPDVLDRINREVSRQNFDTWIKPIKLCSSGPGNVVLGVPNRFFKEWLMDHYHDVINRALREALDTEDVALSFEIVGSTAPGRPSTAPMSVGRLHSPWTAMR